MAVNLRLNRSKRPWNEMYLFTCAVCLVLANLHSHVQSFKNWPGKEFRCIGFNSMHIAMSMKPCNEWKLKPLRFSMLKAMYLFSSRRICCWSSMMFMRYLHVINHPSRISFKDSRITTFRLCCSVEIETPS